MVLFKCFLTGLIWGITNVLMEHGAKKVEKFKEEDVRYSRRRDNGSILNWLRNLVVEVYLYIINWRVSNSEIFE